HPHGQAERGVRAGTQEGGRGAAGVVLVPGAASPVRDERQPPVPGSWRGARPELRGSLRALVPLVGSPVGVIRSLGPVTALVTGPPFVLTAESASLPYVAPSCRRIFGWLILLGQRVTAGERA